MLPAVQANRLPESLPSSAKFWYSGIIIVYLTNMHYSSVSIIVLHSFMDLLHW